MNTIHYTYPDFSQRTVCFFNFEDFIDSLYSSSDSFTDSGYTLIINDEAGVDFSVDNFVDYTDEAEDSSLLDNREIQVRFEKL